MISSELTKTSDIIHIGEASRSQLVIDGIASIMPAIGVAAIAVYCLGVAPFQSLGWIVLIFAAAVGATWITNYVDSWLHASYLKCSPASRTVIARSRNGDKSSLAFEDVLSVAIAYNTRRGRYGRREEWSVTVWTRKGQYELCYRQNYGLYGPQIKQLIAIFPQLPCVFFDWTENKIVARGTLEGVRSEVCLD